MKDGIAHAISLIDKVRGSDDVPVSFAKIIVELFPPWFDFNSNKFAVLTWEKGLHLIVSGSEYGFAIISTSNSRRMSCIYFGSQSVEEARMDMHYRPNDDQIARAKVIIDLVLRKLFPEYEAFANSPLLVEVEKGRVFPSSWSSEPVFVQLTYG